MRRSSPVLTTTTSCSGGWMRTRPRKKRPAPTPPASATSKEGLSVSGPGWGAVCHRPARRRQRSAVLAAWRGLRGALLLRADQGALGDGSGLLGGRGGPRQPRGNGGQADDLLVLHLPEVLAQGDGAVGVQLLERGLVDRLRGGVDRGPQGEDGVGHALHLTAVGELGEF